MISNHFRFISSGTTASFPVYFLFISIAINAIHVQRIALNESTQINLKLVRPNPELNLRHNTQHAQIDPNLK